MFFLFVGLYFSIISFVAWLFLFPAGREWFLQIWRRAMHQLMRGLGCLHAVRLRSVGAIKTETQEFMSESMGFVEKHKIILFICLLVVSIPPLLAWLVSDRRQFDAYQAPVREMNQQVAELLKGEQLVPPAPLPPMLFLTEEVVQVRPMLSSASRNWDLLNKDFSQRLLLVFKIMKEQHGYEMALLEGYRSPERQNVLAAMGSNVTNAAAFQSYHQYGLAADCAFLRDGKLVISEKDEWAMRGYRLYGEVAESVGLTWGGRWKMMDFGHTELHVRGVLEK